MTTLLSKTLRNRLIFLVIIFGITLAVCLLAILVWDPFPSIATYALILILLFTICGTWYVAASMINDLESHLDRCERKTQESAFTMNNFMYHIAHTLRTPLNEIRWSVETLKNEEFGELNGEQRELMDKLESSSVDLLKLADDLQDALLVLRGEPIRMTLSNCSIIPLIDDVAGTWAVAARRKRITLVWKHPKERLPEANCDAARVRQVLNVLVDNAIHYTKTSGKVTISLRVIGGAPTANMQRTLKIPEQVRNTIIVCVHDQGIGIPAEDQEHIFKAFYRASNARDAWVDGEGIGLTLARAIVIQLGGTMWFSSTKGRGTTVCFSLPAVF